MFIGIILALISVSCYAGYQLSNKENIVRYGLHKSTLYLYMVAQIILTAGLIIGYMLDPALLIKLLKAGDWLFMIGLGFEGALTIILYFWLLDKTRLGLSYTLSSTYSIMTVISAVIFLHEDINTITFIAIIIALSASLWLGFINSVKFHKGESRRKQVNNIIITIILPLGVAVGWTIFNFGSKKLVDAYGGLNTAFFTEGAVLLWIILWAVLQHRRELKTLLMERTNILNVSKTALFFGIGGIAFYLSLSLAPLSIVAGILGLAPAIVFALSIYYLKEKFTLSEIISIGVIIISIGCISVFR